MEDLNTIKKLISKYGNKSLEEIQEELKGDNQFECPECKGLGYVEQEYNGYPSGLPDSGWAYKASFRKIECECCNGLGYTRYKLIPHYIQDGWCISDDDKLKIKQEINDKINEIKSNIDYYGKFQSPHLIEKENEKLKNIDTIYPLIKRKV